MKSTPVIAGGRSQRNIVGVSATIGELLWHIPFSTPYQQNIVTPVLYHETLLFSGLENGVMGVKALKRGSEWVAETVWQNKDVGMYMSSPVVTSDLMFGLSYLKRGQFFCLDPRTGTTLWTSEGRQADNAAIVGGGSVLLFLTNDAELIVAKKSGKGFEPLRKYSVADSPTLGAPGDSERRHPDQGRHHPRPWCTE